MDNRIIGNITLNNAKIEFKGTNNILICKSDITLENCKIRFTGSNSLIYFDINKYPFSINIRVGNDSVFYLGKNCYLNRTSNMYATERKNIIIGNECLLSFDSYFRTADPHIIYSTDNLKRINYSKSIVIGDHVWIGQQALLLKNTYIGSGSIIGGKSVVAGKTVPSNTLYAGNPAKKVNEQVFYSNPKSTHNFTEEEELNSDIFDNNNYCYELDKNTIDLKQLDMDLQKLKDVNDKVKYIEEHIVNNNKKNRFYI